MANAHVARESTGSSTAGCCGPISQENVSGLPIVAIVGSPNVGKSVMFNNLTGRYVTVSSYPGTTVEVSRGRGRIEGKSFGMVDTPRHVFADADHRRGARRAPDAP